MSKSSRRRNRQRGPQQVVPAGDPAASPVVQANVAQVVGLAMEQITFSGPLPPPSVLQGYNQVLPGAADRILSMAERQMQHRQSLELKVIGSDVWRAWAGLLVGGLLALVLTLSGAFVIYHGHDWAGTTAITSTLVALAGVFVYGSVTRRNEREQKAAVVRKPRAKKK